MKTFTLKLTDNSDKDFIALTRQLDNDLDNRYGEVQNIYNKFNKLIDVDKVIVAYSSEIPAGCGSYKKYNTETVEIKRMFVKPEFRGTGVAKLIYDELEKLAFDAGYTKAILETGVKQMEAIRFYTKLGYSVIDNYEQYIGLENSVCMGKDLNKF
jgi:putative acetyltransferase